MSEHLQPSVPPNAGDPVTLATQALRNNDRAEFTRLFAVHPHLLRVPPPHSGEKSFLWLACMNHRPATLHALLTLGVPIDCAPHGMSMVCWAMGNGKADVAETLLQRGSQGCVELNFPD